MQTHQIENLLSLAVLIARARPEAKTHEIPIALGKLQRLATSLHKRYEAACNYDWACTPEYEARTGRLETKAEEIARGLNIRLTHQRDPRGWPLVLDLDGHEYRIG